MSEKNRSLLRAVLLCVVLVILAFPVPASADAGPKPSVRIRFENMGEALCYGTLLSESDSTGPYSAWDGTEEDIRTREEYPHSDYPPRAVWEAFAAYQDPDGCFFLQKSWTVSETGEIAWTYYPPDRFKILLYYPETGTFVSSGICESYAFDSYYTVDLAGVDPAAGLTARRSYDYRQEVTALAARFVLTIAAETAVALLFGFREKRQFRVLLAVNLATQLALNLLLGLSGYRYGPLAFALAYLLLELAVIAAEIALYRRFLPPPAPPQKVRSYGVYSLVANGVSFGAGWLLSGFLPDLF